MINVSNTVLKILTKNSAVANELAAVTNTDLTEDVVQLISEFEKAVVESAKTDVVEFITSGALGSQSVIDTVFVENYAKLFDTSIADYSEILMAEYSFLDSTRAATFYTLGTIIAIKTASTELLEFCLNKLSTL